MTNTSYFGLSLQQRLEQAGKNEAFQQAVSAGNERALVSLLEQIGYSTAASLATAQTFLSGERKA